MNEAETKAELIDPKLKEDGWDSKANPDVRVRREYHINAGKIKASGGNEKPLIADYVLTYKNRMLAVVEAKSDELEVGEGVAQAKEYATKLKVDDTYSANGKEIYHIDMETAREGLLDSFHTPETLWHKAFRVQNQWQDNFNAIPYEDKGGSMGGRFYQEIAVDKVMDAVADKKNRILLTLATGTGKTFISFQIAWKLFYSRWNLKLDGTRRPRILFLADRNILANQAFNAFSAFPEDALVRISPKEIRKKGSVPTNGSIFFTIFQTFMSGGSTSSPTTPKNLISPKAEPIEATTPNNPISPKAEPIEATTPNNPISPKAEPVEATTPKNSNPVKETETVEDISQKDIELKEVTQIEDALGYMYILECADGSFYTGSTKDLTRRLEQHKNGAGAEHTKKYLPVKLVYYEPFDRIDRAFDREKQIQGWSRAKKIALIKGQKDLLKELSASRNSTTKQAEDKSPEPVEGNFGAYPPDYFDFIIIDECHRGGANDESTWRAILEYFAPAVQIGLTATPKRKDNVDTYKYFGEPVYVYSLKDGINDGFLTPFKVKRIKTTLDEYTYDDDDTIVEGDIEKGKTYKEDDFNAIIEIKAREAKRVQIFMDLINQNEKTLVFCASQAHAAAVRDLINQYKASTSSASSHPNYCVRVTANDGELGEQYLREFQDNEKSIPTILTTSHKLSTGVDARNIRNIVLMRPIKNIVEFKQIIGRGTRLFDGKYFFTIYDFVNASERFNDPEWDGEPIDPPDYPDIPPEEPDGVKEPFIDRDKKDPIPKIKIKLKDGKERDILHSVDSTFWGRDGKPISVQEFLNNLFGKLPDFFNSEDELRKLWSDPATRKVLLEKLAEAGYGKDELATLQKIIDAEKSDLFDVLEYIAFSINPITREARVASAKKNILSALDYEQQAFLNFVLSKYIETGVEELAEEKLSPLLELKYHSINDAVNTLGGVGKARELFIQFQKHLYDKKVA